MVMSCTREDKRVSEGTWMCASGGGVRGRGTKFGKWIHERGQVNSYFSKIVLRRGPLCSFKTSWKIARCVHVQSSRLE